MAMIVNVYQDSLDTIVQKASAINVILKCGCVHLHAEIVTLG